MSLISLDERRFELVQQLKSTEFHVETLVKGAVEYADSLLIKSMTSEKIQMSHIQVLVACLLLIQDHHEEMVAKLIDMEQALEEPHAWLERKILEDESEDGATLN